MTDRKGGNFVFDNNWSNEETFRLASALDGDGYEKTVGVFINKHRNDGWTPDVWRTQISKLIFQHLWDTYDRLDANANRVEDLLITQPGLFGFRICEISEAYMRRFGLDGSDTDGSSKKSRKSKTNASKPTKSGNIKSRTIGHRVRKSKEDKGKTSRRN